MLTDNGDIIMQGFKAGSKVGSAAISFLSGISFLCLASSLRSIDTSVPPTIKESRLGNLDISLALRYALAISICSLSKDLKSDMIAFCFSPLNVATASN